MYGELVPVGGGDPIPLIKDKLLVGRRESCDITLRFANVSAHHCELRFENGYLYIRDLGSSNGIKINGVKLTEGRLDPGDDLTIAKHHHYKVNYSPADLGAVGPPPPENDMSREIMKESLLARAGLQNMKPRSQPTPRKYDPTNMSEGQIKKPHEAL